MTLGDMHQLGVQRLVAYCLNDACRHEGLIDVSKYPEDTEVPWFRSRVVCAKCGGRGNKIDVRPNWKNIIEVRCCHPIPTNARKSSTRSRIDSVMATQAESQKIP
jgi:hypothetical protein